MKRTSPVVIRVSRRVGDLGTFGADLLKEFQRVSHFFGVPSISKLLVAVPHPCHVPFKTTISGNQINGKRQKNQGAEPEGHAPQFSLIINSTRNANSNFLFCQKPAQCLPERTYELSGMAVRRHGIYVLSGDRAIIDDTVV